MEELLEEHWIHTKYKLEQIQHLNILDVQQKVNATLYEILTLDHNMAHITFGLKNPTKIW